MLAVLVPRLAFAQPAPASCAAPAEMTASETKLPHVAAAVNAGTLGILAVGSATMLGPRGGTEGSVPSRMASYLRAALPAAAIELSVHGERGITAADMLGIIRTELEHHQAQLVLWQTATVEAARGLPIPAFLATLTEGARLVASAGADLILVDPQYGRLMYAKTDLAPYEHALAEAAALPGVVLFHRFDLMRHWVETGQIDLERASRPDRQQTTDMLHECLGRALAHLVLDGAGREGP